MVPSGKETAGRTSRRSILQACSLDPYAYQIDPYIGCKHDCSYCYAQNDAEVDWPREVRTHEDLEARLARELDAIPPQSIYMGMNSDPYQPAEAKRLQTRKILELLVKRGCSACVLTKSGLITRDLDLFRQMPAAYLGFSLAFHEEATRTLFERNAPSLEERLQGLRTLREAELETYALICPVIPEITEVEEVVRTVASLVKRIYIYRLRMSAQTDANWCKVKTILDKHFPALADRYRQIAFCETDAYWRDLAIRLASLRVPVDVTLSVEL